MANDSYRDGRALTHDALVSAPALHSDLSL
jgi:hypothetical protein